MKNLLKNCHLALLLLLCWLVALPQMVGTLLVAPVTENVSVLQTVSLLGWAMLNEIKSKLFFFFQMNSLNCVKVNNLCYLN